MKFIDSLKVIKAGVINELFNIDTAKIKMNPIVQSGYFSFESLYLEISRGKKNEQILSLSKEEIGSLVLKYIKKYNKILKK